MAEMTSQQAAFQERLKKLSHKNGQPQHQEPQQDSLKADYAAHEARREAARPKLTAEEAAKVLNPGLLENIKYPLSFVRAFAVGVFAVLLVQVIRFHLFNDGMSADGLDLVLFLDGGLAAGLGFVLKTALDIQAKELQTTQFIGVVVGITCLHNLYHFAPTPMSVLTSPEWTAEMQYYSVPYSVWYRGNYYVLYDDGSQDQPKLPQAWTISDNW